MLGQAAAQLFLAECRHQALESVVGRGRVVAGKEAEARGGYYHPAANAAYDRLSGGRSSYIQMQSLITNARLAQKLTR